MNRDTRPSPSSPNGYALIVILIAVLIVGLLSTLSLPSKKTLPEKDFPPPKTVVQEYYKQFIDGNIPAATEMLWVKKAEKRYMQPLLMERLYQRHTELRMQGGLRSAQVKTVNQKEDTAAVEVEETLDNGDRNTTTLNLRKGEEGWKIVLW
ncbi:MAG: DUF4878 domain-containing protein [Betaproteobacteria bacterium]|nr:DUF4878 domain-containing protein [Betaproteobacteria bacterium]